MWQADPGDDSIVIFLAHNMPTCSRWAEVSAWRLERNRAVPPARACLTELAHVLPVAADYDAMVRHFGGAMTGAARRRSIGCVLAMAVAFTWGCAAHPSVRAVPMYGAGLSDEAYREQLQAALRGRGDAHDTYLEVARLANETTVPLLLARFQREFPSAAPAAAAPSTSIDPAPYSVGPVGPVVARFVVGFDCAQGHLVDALTFATNANHGMYYPDWQAWWTENQHKARREWIAQGFKEAGLSPSDPIDEQFGIDLIGLLPDTHRYLVVNARRLLETVPVADLGVWIEKAGRSPQAHHRLGAASALLRLEPAGHEGLLRVLTADADADVRQAALHALNARVRQRPDHQATAFLVRKPTTPNDFSPVAVDDDLLVAGGGHSIQAFDAHTGRRRWRNRSLTARSLLILSGRIVATHGDGALAGLDARGKISWRWPERHAGEFVYRLFAIDRDLGVLYHGRLEWRDPDTGRIVHELTADGIRDADASGRTVYVLMRDELQKVVDGRVLARREVDRGSGVSARDGLVCVIGGELSSSKPAALSCYDADTLALCWARPVAPNEADGHRAAPVLSASRVYVPSTEQLTVLRLVDGSPLWTDGSFRPQWFDLLVSSWGLSAVGPDGRRELRDVDTGEVAAVWPVKAGHIVMAPSGRVFAFGGEDGSVWILRPPDVLETSAGKRQVRSADRRP
jgi:outer membrane protein assembly factor BamB